MGKASHGFATPVDIDMLLLALACSSAPSAPSTSPAAPGPVASGPEGPLHAWVDSPGGKLSFALQNGPGAAWTVRNGAETIDIPRATEADGVTVSFVVTGNEASTVPVRYSGILPDLFVEGSGVVADGSLQADGTFLATNLLAKHDENYVPKELEGLEGHDASDKAAETIVGL